MANAPAKSPSAPKRSRKSRARLRWLRILLLSVTLVSLGYVLALTVLNGERLAMLASTQLSSLLHGKFRVERAFGSRSALTDVILGRPTTVHLEGVHIFDPLGTEIIGVREVNAYINLRDFLLAHVVHFTRIDIADGHCLLAETNAKGEPFGLVEAFSPRAASIPSPSAPGLGVGVVLENIHIEGVDYRMRVGQTEVSVDDVNIDGASLRLEGSIERIGMQLTVPQMEGGPGYWKQHGVSLPLRNLRSRDVRIAGHDLIVDIGLVLLESATRVTLRMPHLFDDRRGLELAVQTDDLGTALARLTERREFSGGQLELKTTGHANRPIANLTVSGLNVAGPTPDLAIRNLALSAQCDLPRDMLTISQLGGEWLHGQLRAHGALNMRTNQWRASVDIRSAKTGAFHPAMRGGLNADVTLHGHLGSSPSTQAHARAQFARAKNELAWPHSLEVNTHLALAKGKLDVPDFRVQAGKDVLTGSGAFRFASRQVEALLDLEAGEPSRALTQWLGFELFRSLSAHLAIHGRFPQLSAQGSVALVNVGYGKQRVPKLSAELAFRRGEVRLTGLNAAAFGGHLRGEVSVGLLNSDLGGIRAAPPVNARIELTAIELGNLVPPELAQGRLSGLFEVGGALPHPRGMLSLRMSAGAIHRVRVDSGSFRVALLADRIRVEDAQLKRRQSSIRVWGDLHYNHALDAHLQASRFALHDLDEIKELGVTTLVDGQLSATGPVDDPQFSGNLQLQDLTYRNVPVGQVGIQLLPGDRRTKFRAALQNRSAAIDGIFALSPKPTAEANLHLQKFPVHIFLPSMLPDTDVKSGLTGDVAAAFDEHGLTRLGADITEIVLALGHGSVGQQKNRFLRVTNQGSIRAQFTKNHRVQLDPFQLVARTSDKAVRNATFAVGGFVGAAESDLAVQANVPLKLAEFFLGREVESVLGNLDTSLHFTGPMTALGATGSVSVQDARLFLPRFDVPVEVPVARFTLATGRMNIDSFRFKMADQVLVAWGSVGLAPHFPFAPLSYDTHLKGELNMKLLALLFRDQFALASGVVGTELNVTGPTKDPQIAGDLDVRSLEAVPRGGGRTITLRSGHLAFSNYFVCLGGHIVCAERTQSCGMASRECRTDQALKGAYGEGAFSAAGEARFDRRRLADVYLTLNAVSVPQREPDVYSAELNTQLTLVGDDSGLSLSGRIDVVDARYVREFDVLKDFIIQPRVSEETAPFWTGVPLLENLALNLSLRSTGKLEVKNTYANLGLQANLNVSGVLSDPRLHGTVRVEDGTFRIPFLRGLFRVDRGDIAFDHDDSPKEAELNITAQSQYTDSSGSSYLIQLRLIGPMQRIRIELTSQPHLEVGQIMALLATGQTTDQLRSHYNSTTADSNRQRAVGAADAQLKELTGQLLSTVLEDPLRQATGLDLVRLEVGSETVSARGCKDFGPAVEICGEYRKNLFGGSGGAGSVLYKMHDYLKLSGNIERLAPSIDRTLDFPTRARLELKYRIPVP